MLKTLINNPNTPPETLERIADILLSRPNQAALQIVSNSMSPISHRSPKNEQETISLLQHLAGNPKTPPKTLERIAERCLMEDAKKIIHPELLNALVGNPTTPPETLGKIADGVSNTEIINIGLLNALVDNPKTPPKTLEKLNNPQIKTKITAQLQKELDTFNASIPIKTEDEYWGEKFNEMLKIYPPTILQESFKERPELNQVFIKAFQVVATTCKGKELAYIEETLKPFLKTASLELLNEMFNALPKTYVNEKTKTTIKDAILEQLKDRFIGKTEVENKIEIKNKKGKVMETITPEILELRIQHSNKNPFLRAFKGFFNPKKSFVKRIKEERKKAKTAGPAR